MLYISQMAKDELVKSRCPYCANLITLRRYKQNFGNMYYVLKCLECDVNIHIKDLETIKPWLEKENGKAKETIGLNNNGGGGLSKVQGTLGNRPAAGEA